MANVDQILLPVASKDYPRNYAEFLGWFSDDAACLDYLDWLAMAPISFHDLVANPKPRKDGEVRPTPPSSRQTAPSSLRMQTPSHPWRHHGEAS